MRVAQILSFCLPYTLNDFVINVDNRNLVTKFDLIHFFLKS